MNEGTLSVLCADLTGGERLHQKLGASEAAHAIGRYQKRIVQTLEGFRGRLAAHAGLRVMAFFSEAEDALQSAVELQRRISTLPPQSGVALGVRVGVCVGHGSDEMRFFDDLTDNAAISLSGFAQPGQVLLSVPKRAKGFNLDEHDVRSHPEITVRSGKRQLGVFEIDWRAFGGAMIKATAEGSTISPVRGQQLFIHFQGETLELNAKRNMVSVGRLASCGLRLHSERCSRVHARIEQRGDTFVLIDQSTNGTFVLPEGGSEHHVHNHQLVLSGRGQISFGEPVKGNPECAHYAIGARSSR